METCQPGTRASIGQHPAYGLVLDYRWDNRWTHAIRLGNEVAPGHVGRCPVASRRAGTVTRVRRGPSSRGNHSGNSIGYREQARLHFDLGRDTLLSWFAPVDKRNKNELGGPAER